MTFVDYFGYLASLIILISVLMSSIKKLRWINLFGALLFTIYGYFINSIPVLVMNFGIVLVDIYYLYQIYTKKDYFTLLDIEDNSVYLSYFIEFYNQNINNFIDIKELDLNKSDIRLYILRNVRPAGIFLASKYNQNTLEIDLDYVIPEFQDFKMGNFLFNKQKDYFHKKGINKFITTAKNEKHIKYLVKMGFNKEVINNIDYYVLNI